MKIHAVYVPVGSSKSEVVEYLWEDFTENLSA